MTTLNGIFSISGLVLAVSLLQTHAMAAEPAAEQTFQLQNGGVAVGFRLAGGRLALRQIQRPGEPPLLYEDRQTRQAGAGPAGNPLAVVIRQGRFAGTNGMNSFRVVSSVRTPTRLRAYLEHDVLPLQIGMDISVEGNVIQWLGQALWNGEESVEADIYFPLLSRVRLANPQTDRLVAPQISGSVRAPLGQVNYAQNYVGRLASPVFLVEGGGRGMAWLDDNRADYAADPGATCLRSYLVGNEFPPRSGGSGGEAGPLVGVGHKRVFKPITAFGGEAAYRAAEAPGGPMPLRKLGDAVDLGPVLTYLYSGSWKAGAAWLRERRAWVPFRVNPGAWYQRTTFVGEEGGGALPGKGGTFHGLSAILEEKRRLGVDVFFITGFSDAEVVGTTGQSRGDYFFAAEHLGGFASVRPGVEALHRAGGRLLYYLEGMIIWKRSRIGRSVGQEWALMEPDGRYTEHYRGFWHACPAHPGYQDWLARTCADILRTTGIDGFFIDSTLATYNHRCFNPAHRHPHPDVWTWGIRRLLQRIREECDRVNPEAVLLVEGCADIGREHGDGFIAHSHFWNQGTFQEPLVRFLHPDMRAYESWGYTPRGGTADDLKRWFIWNCVQGYRVYAHNAACDTMAELSRHVRRYYDSFPEICDSPMSVLDAHTERCVAQLFEGPPPVVTVGNTNNTTVTATLTLPKPASVLFDRVTGRSLTATNGVWTLSLGPWEYRAFEIRP